MQLGFVVEGRAFEGSFGRPQAGPAAKRRLPAKIPEGRMPMSPAILAGVNLGGTIKAALGTADRAVR